MSIIRKNNIFKKKNIGSLKDYKDRYEYLKERDKQKYSYRKEKIQENIERTKQDRELERQHLLNTIERKTNKLKIKLVNELTSLHTLTVVIFSILSAIMSTFGVAYNIKNVWIRFAVVSLMLILMLANNIAIQPKFINSFLFKKEALNILGSISLGLVTLGVLAISLFTNYKTLELMQLSPELAIAFTSVFDVSVLGLNLLHYSTITFNVSDKVKKDLNITNNSSDITNNSSDITNEEKAKEYINNLINNTKEGEQIRYNKHDMDFSSSYFYRLLNENELIEKKNNKYYKKKVA